MSGQDNVRNNYPLLETSRGKYKSEELPPAYNLFQKSESKTAKKCDNCVDVVQHSDTSVPAPTAPSSEKINENNQSAAASEPLHSRGSTSEVLHGRLGGQELQTNRDDCRMYKPVTTAPVPESSRFSSEISTEQLTECSSNYIEWCFYGLVCSSWTNVKIGKYLGQSKTWCRYLVPTIIFLFLLIIWCPMVVVFLDFNGHFVDDILRIIFFTVLAVILVLGLGINVIMTLILRRRYVEDSEIDESVCQSMLLMMFCRPCAYGEMGNYIKIKKDRTSQIQEA